MLFKSLTPLSIIALCLGLSHAFFWSKPRCDDVPIKEKLMALDVAVGSGEGGDEALALLDVDRDGCVDKWEWMWTLQTEFGLGAVTANSSFSVLPAALHCGSAGPAPRPAGDFVDASLELLITACGRPAGHPMFGRRFRRHLRSGPMRGFFGHIFGKMFGKHSPPTLFDTDCDCKAARAVCMSDARLSHSAVCEGQSVCTDKGSLASRIEANLNNNDPNGDGLATAAEIYIDVSEHYDQDGDDCVTREDFIINAMRLYNISEAMAAGRFPPPPGRCLFVPSSFLPGGTMENFQLTKEEFIDDNLGALVAVCDGLSQEEFKGNCDCSQLEDSCRSDPFLQPAHSCMSYLACQGKGSLGHRFTTNLNNNDQDGDGNVTAAEIYLDVSEHYDQDGDDCVTREDFVATFQRLYNFSEAVAAGRFPPSEDRCLFVPSEFLPGGVNEALVIPDDEFVDANIDALIKVCEGLNPEEFASNCDCAQLSAACSDDALLKGTPSCVAYLQQ